MKLVWHPLAMADRECIMDFIACDKLLAAFVLDENYETHADRIESETITVFSVLHAAQRWPSA